MNPSHARMPAWLVRCCVLALLFAVYTLSYGPWVLIGSRCSVPGGEWIHHGFFGPLHWLSECVPAYGWVTRELFWWGYGPV